MTLNWRELWDEDEQRYRVQTRDGRKVRIFTTEARHGKPVVGNVELKLSAEEMLTDWTTDGEHCPNPSCGLRLIPEPRTVRRWVNVYRTAEEGGYRLGRLFFSEDIAKAHPAGCGIVATVPVEWEE